MPVVAHVSIACGTPVPQVPQDSNYWELLRGENPFEIMKPKYIDMLAVWRGTSIVKPCPYNPAIYNVLHFTTLSHGDLTSVGTMYRNISLFEDQHFTMSFSRPCMVYMTLTSSYAPLSECASSRNSTHAFITHIALMSSTCN